MRNATRCEGGEERTRSRAERTNGVSNDRSRRVRRDRDTRRSSLVPSAFGSSFFLSLRPPARGNRGKEEGNVGSRRMTEGTECRRAGGQSADRVPSSLHFSLRADPRLCPSVSPGFLVMSLVSRSPFITLGLFALLIRPSRRRP